MIKILWVCLLTAVYGTVTPQTYISADILVGKVLKHRTSLLFEEPRISSGIGLTIEKQTSGEAAWQQYWRLPKIVAQISYLNFGNNEVLGNAISFNPGLIFSLKDWKKTNLELHYSSGIAYLSKKFDLTNNPSNNAIGSHWNNNTRLKLSLLHPLNHIWSIRIGLEVSHYSNGLTSSPNSGLNVYGLGLGLIYQPHFRAEELLEPIHEKYRKWGINVQVGAGKTESIIPNGPEYLVTSYSMGGYWRYAAFQKLHIGIDHEYSEAVYEFERAIFTEKNIAQKRATRNIIYIGNEMIFGPYHFKPLLGFYTPIASAHQGKPLYFKLQSSFYSKHLAVGDFKPYLGIVLKTHNAVAEYIGLIVGFDY